MLGAAEDTQHLAGIRIDLLDPSGRRGTALPGLHGNGGTALGASSRDPEMRRDDFAVIHGISLSPRSIGTCDPVTHPYDEGTVPYSYASDEICSGTVESYTAVCACTCAGACARWHGTQQHTAERRYGNREHRHAMARHMPSNVFWVLWDAVSTE